jgi:hypothetical protein
VREDECFDTGELSGVGAVSCVRPMGPKSHRNVAAKESGPSVVNFVSSVSGCTWRVRAPSAVRGGLGLSNW